ncbi:peptidoglycan-binding protein [Sulfitobacter sp. M57]|uniref:peptidoglycan-binding domain-containing protein n=1 Tax=unclassified Sulfitobacter TaxID=196795 RepID=UPI0023E3214B|nr:MULTISPECIES: peptidoglycan-binding domain-containing protein [unclassified Sulfitobacter]MDF3414188.1 peptidoglycan-binding protein [Sulfitobacter sp. KE5]MDF3420531.1 peptidoglycan-binding protein [Sulfitobacter sp. KE43]MDF3432734.1 peptidoglycan-binding protein [Sulfitobacter sp. KE42]MDF3458373.1 peptidoglycan-binding protein [Sulfitobacter sp. S74]MDF3462274.1 peptidoglycan-binding protein [Sulfitobacter sp. Ks18]
MTQAIFKNRRAWHLALALLTCTALAGCDPVTSPSPAEPPEPGVLEATRNGPADAPAGSCWGKTISPAVVERVTEQVQIKPALVNPDGTIGRLPVYRTEKRQVIVTPRRDNWFQTPCPDVLTPEFLSSLQRALQVRGGYSGAITGKLDAKTRTAVERFQRAQGLDSAVLSLATARTLGLIAVPRVPSE